jgi:hypothetical protein
MNKEQIAFEKHMESKGYSIAKDGQGNYHNIPTHYFWLGWQARAALDKAELEEVIQGKRWLLAQVTDKMPDTAFICGTSGRELAPNIYEGFIIAQAYGGDNTFLYVMDSGHKKKYFGIEKQDTSEIVAELDKALIMGSDVGALAMIPMDLLTKIRKHLAHD